jgi:hypothetical protein
MKNSFLRLSLLLSFLLPVTFSFSQADVEGDYPVEFAVYNPCCEEEILISGIGHFVVNNNVVHVSVADVTGIGLSSGSEYTSHGVIVQNNIKYSSPVEGSLIFNLRMVNADGCSFKMKLTLHLTVNANGDVTANVENVQFHCQ